jgi:sporulation protein YlmC with PRC-barrel domain
MLRSLKDLKRYTVSASDGDLGTVANFLLDDERWAIRYLVVDAGLVHNRNDVLISPVFFREVDWATRCFHLAMTRDRIEKSPSVDVDKPVSRQHERDYHAYYGYPYYWGYPGLWGLTNYPVLMLPGPEPAVDLKAGSGDVHLRSAKEVVGYDVQTSDGSVGRVADFVVDDQTWKIQYLVIDTNHWWFGKKVLVAPEWAKRISWAERTVDVGLSRETIKKSPAWNPEAGVNRVYESRLYDYYGRPAYWDARAREATMGPQPGNHFS